MITFLITISFPIAFLAGAGFVLASKETASDKMVCNFRTVLISAILLWIDIVVLINFMRTY